MKKKFETNVAAELPKTRTREPNLPWKLNDQDLAELGEGSLDHKADIIAAEPLKTRALFPILLVLVIFVAALNMMAGIYIDSENARSASIKRDGELAILKSDLNKAVTEKAEIGESAARLEKKIEDLKDQKELFTAALESLTRKSDEVKE
jgi:hypothetical protein